MQELLAHYNVLIKQQVDAKKHKLSKAEALNLAQAAEQIFSARGKKVTRLNLRRDRPTQAAIASSMLGPSGNLRAPTVRIGRSLVVGFHVETYKQVLRIEP